MGKLNYVYDNSVILSIASLAANDAISIGSKIDASREQGFRVVKSEGWFIGRNLADEEQVVVCIIADAMVAAEGEVGVESDPQSLFDFEEIERAGRSIFPIGILHGEGVAASERMFHFENKVPWTYPEGSAMSYMVYNIDDAALSAASQELIGFVKHTGVWLRD